jgi:hypothetical protein
MEVGGQLHAPVTLSPEKEPSVLLGLEAAWPHSWSGRCGVEQDILPVPGVESRPSSPYPIPIPTELSRLLLYRIILQK